MDDEEGWWTRTVTFGEAVYAARCPTCARFVRADKSAVMHPESADLAMPNATCAKHGRVATPFLGWASDCAPLEKETAP